MNASAITRAREILLTDPARINAQLAARRLLQRHRNCDASTADYYLSELSAHQVFIEMFRTLMPDEYKQFAGKVSGTDLSWKFFTSLGFPIAEDWLQQMVIAGGHPGMENIPIQSCNEVAHEQWEYLDPCWQLASLLYRPEGGWKEDEAESLRRWNELAKEFDLSPKLRPTGRAKFEVFKAVFETQKSPLAFMPWTLRILEYNTGTIFYDFDQDDGIPDVDWSHGNIIWLREQYAIALDLNHRSRKLEKYLHKSNKTTGRRIATACRLYQRARILTHEENLRAVADTGKPLTGIL